MQELQLDAARFQCADKRFTNWIGKFAVRDFGGSVQVKSSYTGFDKPDCVVESVPLPAGVSKEQAIVASDALCRRLREACEHPNVICRVHKIRSMPVAIEACLDQRLVIFSKKLTDHEVALSPCTQVRG